MNKKGFTLVELIAVIVVIGIILAIALPQVLNQLNANKSKLSDKQSELIVEATRIYVDENQGQYSNITTYKICLDTLVNAGAINSDFINQALGSDYNDSHHVEAKNDGKRYIIEVKAGSCT